MYKLNFLRSKWTLLIPSYPMSYEYCLQLRPKKTSKHQLYSDKKVGSRFWACLIMRRNCPDRTLYIAINICNVLKIWVNKYKYSNEINNTEKDIDNKTTVNCWRAFELSNPREYFYNIWIIHLVLPSTPTLMVALVLQLLFLVMQQLDGEQCLPPNHFW